MGCRSAKDKQRREGAVSQRKTHVDEDEVSEERAHIQSSVRPRAAQVTLHRQVYKKKKLEAGYHRSTGQALPEEKHPFEFHRVEAQ